MTDVQVTDYTVLLNKSKPEREDKRGEDVIDCDEMVGGNGGCWLVESGERVILLVGMKGAWSRGGGAPVGRECTVALSPSHGQHVARFFAPHSPSDTSSVQ